MSPYGVRAVEYSQKIRALYRMDIEQLKEYYDRPEVEEFTKMFYGELINYIKWLEAVEVQKELQVES